jgi:hypothetical protein
MSNNRIPTTKKLMFEHNPNFISPNSAHNNTVHNSNFISPKSTHNNSYNNSYNIHNPNFISPKPIHNNNINLHTNNIINQHLKTNHKIIPPITPAIYNKNQLNTPNKLSFPTQNNSHIIKPLQSDCGCNKKKF